MAALDLQEQEQLEQLKAWWQDNSNWILGTLLIVVVTMGGWRGWNYYKTQESIEASTLFQQFLEQVDSGDLNRINDAASAIRDKFSGSAYAARAMLYAAGANEKKQSDGIATTQLQWVIDHAKEEGLKDVARLRLAALLLDQEKYAEAMKQLDAQHTPSFDALYSDLRGDVLLAQGKKDEARSAYRLAYEKIDPLSQYRNLIQIKMDALGAAK